MGVKGAMIVGTRKNADLKQPSCVSLVNCNVLHCLQLRSPGLRANASGNGTWSPHSCMVSSGVGQLFAYSHRPQKISGHRVWKGSQLAYATTSPLHGSGRITSLPLYF
jgi:hypothetical protein